MDPRQPFIDYIEDLAKRHAAIAHSATNKRFFLELDYDKLLGDQRPDNTGWNLVLMGFETQQDDNKHARRVERVTFLFDILKHVPKGDPAALHAVYNDAREIGEELMIRFKEHTENPCDAAVSEGITVPYSLLWQTKRTIETGPRFDHFYGYRFSADVLLDQYLKKASDPNQWGEPS